MKCIENHPHRNTLVGGAGTSSSTRSLQVTIEALKRELVMRDAIHSYAHPSPPPPSLPLPLSSSIIRNTGQGVSGAVGCSGPYTDTLTPHQQQVTVALACDYGIRGGQGLNLGATGGVRTPSAVTHALTGEQEQEGEGEGGQRGVLEVASLAQARGVADALRCALWHACGGDRGRVAAALEGMRQAHAGE
jgi:hypothetical protein